MDYRLIYSSSENMEISKKIKSIKGSLTTELFEKVVELKARGENVISFTAGDLYCDISKKKKKSAIKALNNGTNHYTNTVGIKDLRKAISERIYRKDNIEVDIKNIVVCNGAKQCISNLLNVILNIGDEIIIFNPSWRAYSEITKLAGGVPVIIDLYEEDKYKIDLELLKSKITSKTKAILINNPNNPTGKIIDEETLTKLVEITVDKEILLISDEVYREIVFTKNRFKSLNSLITRENRNNIVVIDSVSKSNALTGWRVGYMNVPEYLVRYLKLFQSYTTSNVNSLAQVVTIDAVLNDEDFIEQLRNDLKGNRDLTYDYLKDISKMKLDQKPDATFYIWANIKKIEKNSILFCEKVLENAHVALVPGIEFGREGYVRISFANSVNDICQGMENLKKYLL